MRTLRGVNTTLCVVLAVAVTGCVLFEQLGFMDADVAFPHALHVDAGLGCEDCHAGASAGEYVHAEAATCAMCHEDIDAEQPDATRHSTNVLAAALAAEAERPARTEDVQFSHAPHAKAGLACADCHGDVASSTTLATVERPERMADCTTCHTERQAPTECRTCHAVIDTTVKPATHAAAWTKRHGQVFRADTGATVDNCSLCHTQSSCTQCHKDNPPSSHDNAWRLRAHGIAASMDRDSCAACHTTDSCQRCHEESRPISHIGTFAAPRDTHCFGCHFPVQDNTCAVCHKGTPSHFDATPLPDNHSPGLNCRQCHGVDVKLPHVDNGSSCILCHK
ncbi:MAG: cytochrome c3 family protein [Planctomycetes bacterium]|nr:cytochrome c3 family protein [Planctomycetota bacterium]